jgi:hypothetical protein
MVWAYGGDPAAAGRTGDLDKIAGPMLDLHQGHSAEDLAASELRRPPDRAGRQDPERRTPRLNPPTASGRCMSSQLT